VLSILKALLSHSLVAELPIQEQAPWRTANYPIAQLPKECPNDSPDIHKLTCDGESNRTSDGGRSALSYIREK
jgi:hypothetical protein